MKNLIILLLVLIVSISSAQSSYEYESSDFGEVRYTPYRYDVTKVIVDGKKVTKQFKGYRFNYSKFEYLKDSSVDYIIAFYEAINDTVGNFIIEGALFSDKFMDQNKETNSIVTKWYCNNNKDIFTEGKIKYSYYLKRNIYYGILEFEFDGKKYKIKGQRR